RADRPWPRPARRRARPAARWPDPDVRLGRRRRLARTRAPTARRAAPALWSPGCLPAGGAPGLLRVPPGRAGFRSRRDAGRDARAHALVAERLELVAGQRLEQLDIGGRHPRPPVAAPPRRRPPRLLGR